MHFLLPELAKWDALLSDGEKRANGQGAAAPDALALGVFIDERPLRGAAGLCDWRLCGRLSRLLKSERMTGRQDEVVLAPPAKARLPFPRLVLFGLGEQTGFDEFCYRKAIDKIRITMFRAGLHRYAVQPPGRSAGLIAPRRALELWNDQAKVDGIEADVTFIESASGQKEASERRARDRG